MTWEVVKCHFANSCFVCRKNFRPTERVTQRKWQFVVRYGKQWNKLKAEKYASFLIHEGCASHEELQ